ncbi:helix-turn-helix transcriptional regulator [Alcaligenes sp. SDU_A2]|uniref:helix-turn-helix transcriptional regulator n=1 Tax=Alcaligenes sp. SDU_A2 TaxID=3136634 RepID=UPI00311E1249
MIRDVTRQELAQFAGLVARLEASDEGCDVRGMVLPAVVGLLRADFGASFVWSAQAGRFLAPRAVNMSADNIDRYDAHFCRIDPISQALRQRRRASFVAEVMPQSELERTEFFHDFLARDGLHHGINIYVFDGLRDLGDFRIWRARGRPPFEQRDKDVLDVLEPYVRRALLREQEQRPVLTAREQDVAALLARGMTDREIGALLGIGFATVRTHLGRLLSKFDCANRVELAARLARRRLNS